MKKSPVHSLLFFLLFVFNSPLPASGSPPFRQFNSSDGLPSSTVFDILQDRDGFIWLATQGGAVKFDSKNFVTFRDRDGLNSTSVVAIAENKKGDLFFATYQNGINILKNNRIYNYYNDREGNQFASSYLLFTEDAVNREILWAYKNSGFLSSLHDSGGTGKRRPDVYRSDVLLNRAEFIGERMLISTNKGLFTLSEGEIKRLYIKGLPEEPLFKITPAHEGSFLIGGKKVIYRIKDDKVVKVYNVSGAPGSSDINELFEDSFGNIWFSLMNTGLFLIRKDTGEETDLSQQTGLRNTSVTSMMQDREGNVWISTYGKGVFCFHNLYLSVLNEFNNLSSNNIKIVLTLPGGEIVAGTSDGVNIFRDGKFFRPPSFALRAQPEYIHHVQAEGNSLIAAGVYSFRGTGTFSFNNLDFKLINRPAFFIRKDGTLISGLFDNGIDIMTDPFGAPFVSDEFKLFGPAQKRIRINDITEDKEGTIWVASSRGVCSINNLKLSGTSVNGTVKYFPDDPVLSNSIISITSDKNGNIWFAGSRGIALFEVDSKVLRSWEKYLDTDISQAAAITFDSEERMWVGTMNGLFLFEKNRAQLFNRHNGFPSGEIQALFYDHQRNAVLAGTSDGIVIFNIGMYNRYPVVNKRVRILNIRNGEKILPAASVIDVNPGERSLAVSYSALSFSAPGSVRYRYRMDDKWYNTQSDNISFANLAPGEHQLTIVAYDDKTGESLPAEITINVIPYFTETNIFRFILLAAFLILVYVVVKIRLRMNAGINAEKLETMSRINEMKHQALSAMMNPHFVFNSLNSVQYLVNTNRKEDANNYIAMMAQLMRKNLESSAQGFIPVSEEISRLKLYLELEKMRFSDRFSYEIITDPEIQPELLLIPNMIIQPFVENSIWHGLSESGSEGLISIRFEMTEGETPGKMLLIKITDNGIGYSRSKKKRDNEHISKGISLIEERLRLLSKKLEIDKPILIDDLSEKSDDASGTEIIITLPEPLIRHTDGHTSQ